MKKNILVLIRVKEQHKALLEQSFPHAQFTYAAPKHVTDEQLQQAQIILGNPPPQRLSGLSGLRLLQLQTAGSDLYDPEGILPANCRLYTASGAYGPAVAEHMLAMTMSLCKKLHLYRDNQTQGLWQDEGEVLSVSDLNILVVGAGDIGGQYARLCKALGAHTIGLRRSVPQQPDAAFDQILPFTELDSLLPQADAVAMALPYTPQTHHLINTQRLALMKPGAFLINGGRGKSIDQQAVLEALHSGRLGGFAADVCDPEPLPPNHPLWKEPNVILTPHIAGLFHLPKTLDLVIALAIRNVAAFLDETPEA